MEKLVTSNFKLGIIAGGQLGKMIVLSANIWDIKTYVLDSDDECPASGCCKVFIKGDPQNFNDVYNFGKLVDMLTFEIENINIKALYKLKAEGKKMKPDFGILKIIQDKGHQKKFFLKNNIPSAAFKVYEHKKDILSDLSLGHIKLPFVQKLRKGGYDGKGVIIIRSNQDDEQIKDENCVIEKMIDIQKEISVIIIARNDNGEIKCFPVVEMEIDSEANLLDKLICPAIINETICEKAISIANQVITSLNFSGLLAIEMFIDTQNRIWVNEISPRPHNSGHHTMENNYTSQYEQMLRAIFNLPLGSTRIKSPSVMVNLLGEIGYEGLVRYEGLTECMRLEGVKVHLYGKKRTSPYRKMGHVTVIAPTIEEAKKKADFVKQNIKVKSWTTQL